MNTTYYPEDDILVIHLSDAEAVREVSHGWNLNISYAEDGAPCEIVILEAKEKGLYPIQTEQTAA